MKHWFLIVLCVAATLTACNNDKADPAPAPDTADKGETVELTREGLKAEIEKQRAALSDVIDVTKKRPEALKLLSAYRSYTDKFPGDDETPAYLLMSAKLAMGLGQHNLAIQNCDRILQHHKDFDHAPDALFLQAMIYDEHLDQKGRARQTYQKVINDYPDHALAADAASILPTLNMSDQDLIKMLKEKNQQNAAES